MTEVPSQADIIAQKLAALEDASIQSRIDVLNSRNSLSVEERVELAQLYGSAGQEDSAETVLRNGYELYPHSAILGVNSVHCILSAET